MFGIGFAQEVGAETLLQLEWIFIMRANTLAIFAAKAPVEPTAPTQDKMGDDGSGFKDFMDTAVHKTDTAQKPSKENSTENQNNTKTEATKSPKSKKESQVEEGSNYQEVSAPAKDKPQSKTETVTKESLVEDNGVLAAQLHELDVNQAEFEALMELLGLNGDADMEALLQSLSQALNLSQKGAGEEITASDLLAKIQQNKSEALNLLKQAGFSDAEAKNLLDQLQSMQNASAQKALDKDADLQAKIDAQLRQSAEAAKKNPAVENNQDESDEAPNLLAQVKNSSKETEKAETNTKGSEKTARSASVDKLQETSKQNEAPRITNQEPVNEKGGAASKLGELLNDKNAQANILQTESVSDSKGFKGLETAKTGPDLQVQPPTATANTAVKAVESSKPILPENLLSRGATEAKIINQIADKMSVRSNGAQNEVHIKLDPPSLGTVRMNITTSGDTVRTVIVAENHAVKQVIENNFNQLRDAMGEQGLKVDSFTVTVGGESNPQNQSGESFDKENNSSPFEQMLSGDTNENQGTETVSLFFGDNQSISVIA